MTHQAKLTIVVDNQAAEGLVSEHGFSAWLEITGRRLLFDTGQGAALADNADELGIALGTVDTLVLSHGHYDHSGGVPLVLSRASTAQVYLHPAATGCRYSLRDGVARSVAMPKAARARLEDRSTNVRWITEELQLATDLGLTGPIARLTDYEDTKGPFFLDADGMQLDLIEDDLALWLRTDRGLVVLVGCSHAGLINTLRQAQRQSKERRLHAVVGGFHLKEASESRVARTVAELQELGPELIVPCHCTGEVAVEKLRHSFGERVVPGFAGAAFKFDRSG